MIRSRAITAAVALAIAVASCGKQLPKIPLPSVGGEGDPCDAGGCVVVYLAPWCGACKLSLPLVSSLRGELAQRGFGFKIVVGADQPGRLRQMAEQIGGLVHLDDGGHFGRAAGVRSFPSWLLVDDRGRVRGSFGGGAPSSGSGAADLALLKDKLSGLAEMIAAARPPAAAPAAPPSSPTAAGAAPLPRVKPDPDCASATSSERCRECCARVATTGYVWVHGAGCRCPR